MELLTASNIIFALLSMVILVFGVLTVTSTKILHAATYLFFVLFGIAGLYLHMSYEFLAAVQLSVYAGGVVVLIVFAILLVKSLGEEIETLPKIRTILGCIAVFGGVLVCLTTLFGYKFITADYERANEIANNVDMAQIGETLMSTSKFQYLLPFEASSVLLLACIIGSLVVAHKQTLNSKEEA